jgi:hypothetical protein
MIDVRETRLSLTEAAELMKVTVKTIYAWSDENASPRLETVKYGGKRQTSVEALNRFAQQNDAGTLAPARMPVQPENYERTLQQLKALHGV